MNFLQLVQRLRQEAGAAGLGPSSTTGQIGNLKRLTDWINMAWMDIQSAHTDWDWMRQSITFDTVLGQATYALGIGPGMCGVSVATFGMWARDTFRNFVTAVGMNSEVFMDYIHYDNWRNAYMYGALRQTTTRPLQISIAPDKSICLGPPPIAGYTILGDYYTAPYELIDDAEIPLLPVTFHMAIVYRALMFYGAFEAAPEVYDSAEREFTKLMRRMTATRIPEILWDGALA